MVKTYIRIIHLKDGLEFQSNRKEMFDQYGQIGNYHWKLTHDGNHYNFDYGNYIDNEYFIYSTHLKPNDPEKEAKTILENYLKFMLPFLDSGDFIDD